MSWDARQTAIAEKIWGEFPGATIRFYGGGGRKEMGMSPSSGVVVMAFDNTTQHLGGEVDVCEVRWDALGTDSNGWIDGEALPAPPREPNNSFNLIERVANGLAAFPIK